jgi:hypothetical protein
MKMNSFRVKRGCNVVGVVPFNCAFPGKCRRVPHKCQYVRVVLNVPALLDKFFIEDISSFDKVIVLPSSEKNIECQFVWSAEAGVSSVMLEGRSTCVYLFLLLMNRARSGRVISRPDSAGKSINTCQFEALDKSPYR